MLIQSALSALSVWSDLKPNPLEGASLKISYKILSCVAEGELGLILIRQFTSYKDRHKYSATLRHVHSVTLRHIYSVTFMSEGVEDVPEGETASAVRTWVPEIR